MKLVRPLGLVERVMQAKEDLRLRESDFLPLLGALNYQNRCKRARAYFLSSFPPGFNTAKQNRELGLFLYNAVFLTGVGFACYEVINYLAQR